MSSEGLDFLHKSDLARLSSGKNSDFTLVRLSPQGETHQYREKVLILIAN